MQTLTVNIRLSEHYHSKSTGKKKLTEKRHSPTLEENYRRTRDVIITLCIAAADRCQRGDGRGERVKES